MAEINQASGQKSDGKVRAKKQSTRIDMTPMVDLAFLLLTFFILTTTFKKMRALEVRMPDRIEYPHQAPPIPEGNVLNLVLAKDNKIYWWIGLDPPVRVTNYSSGGVRKILLQESSPNPKLMVLIKAMDESRFQNLVDILDEMDITRMKRFAVVDFSEGDKSIISAHLRAANDNPTP
ncbi:MAG TPA: biopolymer transporter ExbD [Chryseosolibacter sp.]|nr:biopolymer transporter ExbD [Chryseosolibacter sp.]